jgi:hypothetical protein
MKPGSADSGKPGRIVDMMKMCPEAQADGVPCPDLGRSCEICERALRPADGEAPSDKPDSPVTR